MCKDEILKEMWWIIEQLFLMTIAIVLLETCKHLMSWELLIGFSREQFKKTPSTLVSLFMVIAVVWSQQLYFFSDVVFSL